MKNIKALIDNREGSALALALLILMVMAVVSTATIMSTNTGLSLTAEFKQNRQALYSADGGADYGFGVIERAIANDQSIDSADTANANVTIDTTDSDSDGITDLELEIQGASVNNSDSYSDATPDAQVTIMDNTMNIDIDYLSSQLMPGASTESAARYEGIGAGSSGGVGLYYKVESGMTTSSGTTAVVRIYFKCVEGGGRCL